MTKKKIAAGLAAVVSGIIAIATALGYVPAPLAPILDRVGQEVIDATVGQ